MILVKVDQLFLSNMGFVVILKGSEDARAVPIFIGAAEAQAIAIQLQGVKVPRPLTHDLLKNVLDYIECRLKRIEVCDIRDGTYYGKLVLELDKHDMEIDCRPSDAIALALRAACPIYVHEKVMEEAGRVLEKLQPEQDAEKAEAAAPDAPEKQKPKTPVEILNAKLEKAVAEERYEDAARFRDEINRLKKHADN
ncbi:MAG: bifunctional nuclease family protein [Lentisphaerae bacterium]|nr:bifunctional nuclease family protein [Lentisphaerota bacterium]